VQGQGRGERGIRFSLDGDGGGAQVGSSGSGEHNNGRPLCLLSAFAQSLFFNHSSIPVYQKRLLSQIPRVQGSLNAVQPRYHLLALDADVLWVCTDAYICLKRFSHQAMACTPRTWSPLRVSFSSTHPSPSYQVLAAVRAIQRDLQRFKKPSQQRHHPWCPICCARFAPSRARDEWWRCCSCCGGSPRRCLCSSSDSGSWSSDDRHPRSYRRGAALAVRRG
jgi:hypothetical protein